MPDFSASSTASLKASICTARPRLVAIFIVTARPTGPTWVMVGPMASRYGRTRSSAAASPPTMIESWPCSSVTMLPETGPSRKVAPLAATRPASCARDAGADRAHLHPRGSRPEPRDHAVGTVGDGGERAGVGDHAEDHVRRLRDAARGGGELHAGGDERLGLGRRAVVADERVARVEEAQRHAAAHGAEADEAERGHERRGRGLPGTRRAARARDGVTAMAARARRARGGAASATAIAEISTLQFGCVASRDTSTVVVVGR